MARLAFIFFAFLFTSLINNVNSTVYFNETAVAKYLKTNSSSFLPSNIDYVDCIYVINLDKRLEKWKKTKVLLDAYNIQVNRFSAIDGNSLSYETQQELAGTYPVRIFEGALGCLLSHVSIYKDAYEKGFNVIWIMEDDVQINEELSCISNYIENLSRIDSDWHIFYTDTNTKITDVNSNKFGEYISPLQIEDLDIRPDRIYSNLNACNHRRPLEKGIMQINSRYGMYSYLISRSGIKKLLDYFTHSYVWTHIDRDIHTIENIKQYSTQKDVVTVDIMTGISDTSFNSWID